MSQQGLRQASVRAVTGTAETYEGDWHALFDQAEIPPGDFNGRMLQWVNLKLETAFGHLGEAMHALALAYGAFNFSSLGTFDASTGEGPAYSPALNFSDPRNSGYVALLFEDF